LADLYPFVGRHHTLPNGLRLHYLDEGTGPPVVMVHGNPSWSLYYRRLVLDLRGSYRCLVPDHIGCGWSDQPPASVYSFSLAQRIADFTDWLAAVVPAPQKLTLVVHDWGGMIGTAWAVRHPERVARMVILNTGAFHLPASKPLPRPIWLGRNSRLGAWLIQGANAFSVGACWTCVWRTWPMARRLRRAYCAPYNSWAHRLAVLRFVQTIPLQPSDPGYAIVTAVQDGLARLRDVPMCVQWGARDYVFDQHFLAEWRRRCPHAEVTTYPDAGHYVLEDRGGEISRAVTAFLKRTS
jgi:haloalkane dehalogenase